jgi:hypothetical protein
MKKSSLKKRSRSHWLSEPNLARKAAARLDCWCLAAGCDRSQPEKILLLKYYHHSMVDRSVTC